MVHPEQTHALLLTQVELTLREIEFGESKHGFLAGFVICECFLVEPRRLFIFALRHEVVCQLKADGRCLQLLCAQLVRLLSRNADENARLKLACTDKGVCDALRCAAFLVHARKQHPHLGILNHCGGFRRGLAVRIEGFQKHALCLVCMPQLEIELGKIVLEERLPTVLHGRNIVVDGLAVVVSAHEGLANLCRENAVVRIFLQRFLVNVNGAVDFRDAHVRVAQHHARVRAWVPVHKLLVARRIHLKVPALVQKNIRHLGLGIRKVRLVGSDPTERRESNIDVPACKRKLCVCNLHASLFSRA
eukprot:Opistho-2@29516